jgi:ubiquinone/menaquinone biosynthesis C-methylase UbiE
MSINTWMMEVGMSGSQNVSTHYTHGDLLNAIGVGVAALGKTQDSVTIDDLAPIDEFHIGGRQASEDFLGQLGLSTNEHVLDIGCGLGGTARFVASRYDVRVTGIDITDEYVETGRTLCQWVGLNDRINLQQGDALAMPFEDAAFSGAYTIHVGMNIEDKAGLYADVYRVLRPGTLFGIYDVMASSAGQLTYPVPWATNAETTFVASAQQYQQALLDTRFNIISQRNRRDFALAFFDQLRAKTAAAGGPPPLGLHILMGNEASTKIQNMVQNISNGLIAPVELIAQKAV